METLETRINAFLSTTSGEGFGFGYGSGEGYDNGSGFGDGDDACKCFGYGYDAGKCAGAGAGYGYGNGDGAGYGYGGIKELNGDNVHLIDGIQTIIKSVRGNIAQGFILKNDLTLQPCYIVKEQNYFAHGAPCTMLSHICEKSSMTIAQKKSE